MTGLIQGGGVNWLTDGNGPLLDGMRVHLAINSMHQRHLRLVRRNELHPYG